MTRIELQTEVTNWLADLPEEEYTSALIVARFKKDNENGNANYCGFTGPKEEYMQRIGALAENGTKHGYLSKTMKIDKNK